jgi:hydrogenase maturation factor
VTGDTKVVDKGKGDGLFINTAGIGVVEHDWAIAPASVRPGDAVLLNGDLGRHKISMQGQSKTPPVVLQQPCYNRTFHTEDCIMAGKETKKEEQVQHYGYLHTFQRVSK